MLRLPIPSDTAKFDEDTLAAVRLFNMARA